jgi:hypothetical protein
MDSRRYRVLASHRAILLGDMNQAVWDLCDLRGPLEPGNQAPRSVPFGVSGRAGARPYRLVRILCSKFFLDGFGH